eukprot:gene18155-biopygen6889
MFPPCACGAHSQYLLWSNSTLTACGAPVCWQHIRGGRAPAHSDYYFLEGAQYLVLDPTPCKAGVRLPQGWIVLPGGTPESRISKWFYVCCPPPSTRPTGSPNRNQCALRHMRGSEWSETNPGS